MVTNLITGISGQDGSYLSQLLLDRGDSVIGATRDKHRPLKNLSYLGIENRVALEQVDLTDLAAVLQLYEKHKPDFVYHLAAQSSVGLSFQQPLATMNANLVATFNILEAARLLKIPTRIYHASTSEIYGRPDRLPITEKSAVSPISPYGVAKASAHFTVQLYRESYGMFACSGILFNHESFLRSPNYFVKKVVATAVEMTLDPDLQLHLGDLSVSRDFGYGPDYVRAMVKIIEHDYPDEFIVASGTATKLEDLVRFVFDYLDLDPDRYSTTPDLYRPNEIACQYGDTRKARDDLGWQYTLSIQEMLIKLIEEELAFRSTRDTSAPQAFVPRA